MRYLLIPSLFALVLAGWLGGYEWAANIAVALVWLVVLSAVVTHARALHEPGELLWLVNPDRPPSPLRRAVAWALVAVMVGAGWWVTAAALAAALLLLRSARVTVEAHVGADLATP